MVLKYWVKTFTGLYTPTQLMIMPESFELYEKQSPQPHTP